MVKILYVVKNRLNDTVGYDVQDLEDNKQYTSVSIEKLANVELENAIYVNGNKPYIRGKKSLPIRIEDDSVIPIYHGSVKNVGMPTFGVGKKNNDYGRGFYTTMDYKKAEEWALLMATNSAPSFVNSYKINCSDLNIVFLDDYGPLVWIAEVLKNRGVDGEPFSLYAPFVGKYAIDLRKADIVVGYRADDSYFEIVKAFIHNEINVNEVQTFFYKGTLGEQVFLKSKKAFSKNNLEFTGCKKVGKGRQQYVKNNDRNARNQVLSFINERRRAILYDNYIVTGITFKYAIQHNLKWNREKGVYYE